LRISFVAAPTSLKMPENGTDGPFDRGLHDPAFGFVVKFHPALGVHFVTLIVVLMLRRFPASAPNDAA
jgi:hypothetical protein